MPLPDSVAHLIDNFAANQSEYHKGAYNETQTRIDYVNPFFDALGWDMDNRKGLSEIHREVIHEDAIKIGGTTKAPDYSFRVGGARKFFVETKKPSVHLFLVPGPAFQLRRYAWTVKMPLSILTNFEEFVVYDTRIPPDQKDPAKKARLDYFKYTDYADKWDEIASRFSHDAVLSGAFDQYAEEARDKRISVPVDVAFLSEISGWREKLARNIVQNNPGIAPRELNYAVQMIIDRIIFLRISEDRGAEPEHLLQPLVNKGGPVYPRLLNIFRLADARYNSGLFHFQTEPGREEPDDITPYLTIDDRPLKEIIASVYYPESPFEFSVFPADILGQVYEQFLGKIIRISGKTADVEDKPEVKKAGGVYYTPTYIVDYIVQNTVGKLVDGKTPAQVSKLTILDPACGSGSFLIGAYQFLLDWHLKYYTENDREKWAKGKNATIYQFKKDAVQGELWRLTTAEKKRILLNNIYGVDIDTQAVEVTKLSLLLKVLEGESAELIDNSLKLFKERALPDLENNIKCGNSLIGPDFYTDKDPALFDMDTRLKINTFDWNKGFPAVMKGGGFDVVIGNPPYRRERDFKHLMDEIASTSFGSKYRTARMDLWYYFVFRGLDLVKNRGLLSYITNSYWTSGTGAQKLISTLRDLTQVEEIFSFGKLRVFDNVSGQHMIFRVKKQLASQETLVKLPQPIAENTAEPFVLGLAPNASYLKRKDQLFQGDKVDLQPASDALLAKIQREEPLENLGRIRQGIAENPASINRKTNEKLGNIFRVGEGVFVLTHKEVEELDLSKAETKLLRPYFDLQDIGRYFLSPQPTFELIYSTKQTCPDISAYPKIQKHLSRFRSIMDSRRETAKGANQWWHLHWPREETLWEMKKILSLQMGVRPQFVLTEKPAYVSFSVNVFVLFDVTDEKLEYITGILNSKLLWVWYQHHAKRRGVGLEVNGNVLARSPIRRINFSKPAEKAKHDKMVTLVEQMLKLHKDKAGARLVQEKAMLQQQIEATDAQIDKLVYELYGLTDEEIKIVEAAG